MDPTTQNQVIMVRGIHRADMDRLMLLCRKILGFCLLALVLVGMPSIGSAQEVEFSQVRDHGILYFKRGLYKQAQVQLRKAYKHPDGAEDFVTLFYLSATCYRLQRLEDAFELATRAGQIVGENPRHVARLKELISELRSLYGAVNIQPADGEAERKGRIFFKATTGMINKKKRQRFEAIQERFSTRDARLPSKVYLPYGSYLANNVPFTIEDGAPAPTIKVHLRQVDDGKDGTQEDGFPVLGVSLGAAAATALGVGAVLLLGDETTGPPQNRHPVRFREAPVTP